MVDGNFDVPIEVGSDILDSSNEVTAIAVQFVIAER